MYNEEIQLSREELEKASGGREGQYGWVECYPCPYCHQVNVVNSYCCSGESLWTCHHCGKLFTITF